MAYTADIFGSAIVAVGSFNPAIFSPDWFEANKLIGSDDGNSARGEPYKKSLVVSGDVAVFETKWFHLQVIQNQFSLTSKDALSPAFKDLAIGVFQLLPHTPVTAVGLNFLAHFKLKDEAQYHKVGDVLAPKAIWNEVYPDRAAGVGDLTIKIQPTKRFEQAKTNDEIRIALQPSAKIKFGVYFSYNDHHEFLEKDDKLAPAERVAKVIDECWEASWKDSVRAFDGVLTRALA